MKSAIIYFIAVLGLGGSRVLRTCCPRGSSLDLWYNCREDEADNLEQVITSTFGLEAADLSFSAAASVACDLASRRELEVVSIAAAGDTDTVWVLTNLTAAEQLQEGEQAEAAAVADSVAETEYWCLAAAAPGSDTVVAVVCEEAGAGAGEVASLRKCCPGTQALNPDLSCQDTDSPLELAPRSVVSPATLRPAPRHSWTLAETPRGGWCGAGHAAVADRVASVTTGGGHVSARGHVFPAHTCLDRARGGEQLVALRCLAPARCPQQGPGVHCVSKCCPEHQMFAFRDREGDSLCVDVEDRGHVWRHNSNNNNNITVSYHHTFLEQYVRHAPHWRPAHCEAVVVLDPEEDSFILLGNGSLEHLEYGVTPHYCVDTALQPHTATPQEIVLRCQSGGQLQVVHRNVTEDSGCLEQHVAKLRLLNTLSGAVSCVFLALTLVVYCRVPELNSLHGKIVISNVLSIFSVTAYLVMVYHGSHVLPPHLCRVSGYLGYFFTLSMFCWMTVMSLDLCWTFLRAQVPRRSSASLKFVVYSCVGWGSPALLTLGLAALDHLGLQQGGSLSLSLGLGWPGLNLTLPGVGRDKCWLADTAQGVYLHLPTMLLMLVNGVLFIITITTIYRSNVRTQKARDSRERLRTSSTSSSGQDKANSDLREQMVLYTKLFIVMGIAWIFECVHHLVHSDHHHCGHAGLELIFRLIGCLNLLRGSLIFFIFVCKDSILDKVSKLSVCGCKLTFLQRKQISHFDSVISKGASEMNTTRTNSSSARQDSEPAIPLVYLQENPLNTCP